MRCCGLWSCPVLQAHIHTGSSFGLSINPVSYIIHLRIVAKYDVGQGSPTLNPVNCGCSTKLLMSEQTPKHSFRHSREGGNPAGKDECNSGLADNSRISKAEVESTSVWR